MEKHRKFAPEFKREAVRQMHESGKPVATVARELGVPRTRLYEWSNEIVKEGRAAFAGTGRRRRSNDEVAKLQREVAQLKEENEILKKATAYFAKKAT